ncbi:MAG TPA: HAD-IIIA family hydrolase [Candidatus Saccharimonadales bacterium]|nr:HAD-IIIA family hydrolase [Candidatus Saccharimonadales bacterium]
MKAAIFIDRDGTINRNCPYCKSPDEIVMYGDVFKPIRKLSKHYYIILVTNQSGISRGNFTKKDLGAMHEKIKNEIRRKGGRIDATYYCPHLPEDECGCRKPKTGMIESAISDFDIDLSRSFMVGDSDADIELARRMGITSIRVRAKGNERADFQARDFNQVYDIIKRHGENLTKRWATPKVAVILAGGKGTRMRPLTYKIPKPMALVGGKPIIEHIIRELVANGIQRVFISVGYKAKMIKKHLGDGSGFRTKIDYVLERKPLGTGGGLKLALKEIKDRYGHTDVFVTNGDDLFSLNIPPIYAQHKRTGATGTLTLKKVRDVTGSGVVVLKGKKITGFVEKPGNSNTPSHLINLGKYIFNTDLLRILPKKKKFMFEKEFMQNSIRKANLYGYVVNSRWYPINTVKALREAGKKWS